MFHIAAQKRESDMQGASLSELFRGLAGLYVHLQERMNAHPAVVMPTYHSTEELLQVCTVCPQLFALNCLPST